MRNVTNKNRLSAGPLVPIDMARSDITPSDGLGRFGSKIFALFALLAAAGCSPQLESNDPPPPDEPDTVCGEALQQYEDCGWDDQSPGRTNVQEAVDALYAGQCDEDTTCVSECLISVHDTQDSCWECEFTDADCFGDDEVFNPLMDCFETCPNW